MSDHDHRRPDVQAWRYELPGDWIVLAGKTDADNDRLSLKVAQPRDWWFHLRSGAGSHVILQVPQDEEPDRDVLRQAAAIAAHHSKARNARSAAVSCTRACNVTKPRGAKPGTVQIRKERVLKVKPGLPPGY